MPTKSEIIIDSNLTYVPNTSGLITPQQVQTLNANWINASIFPEQTGSMSVQNAATASFLLGSVASASFSTFAVSASQSTSASFATTALSASFVTTSSLATTNLTTASAAANVLTFTKGDGTTFNVTVAQSGSVTSASYADTANFANTAGSVTSASFAISASRAISAATATSATSATSALTSISASFATTAGTANTASFVVGYAALGANQTFTGINTFNNAVTMSNVRVTGTASIAFLDVTFQSSSIIYSSGSNQFGDASNDTQTLYGTVNVITGPLVVTGSANFASVITGSISTALNANTASYVANAFISASQVGGNDKVSLTNMSGTTTTLTINNVDAANTAGSANTATSASYATVAGTAISALTASYSTNFLVSGSLVVTGSATISTGSLILYSYKATTPSNRSFEASVTQSADSTNNIISIVSTSAATTGSIVISGSGNYISLSATQGNTTNANGTTSGFSGLNAYLTALPQTSGSNPNFNTATDRNNRRVPQISNSNVNSIVTVNDNRASETSTPLTISNSSVNSTFTANIGSGSLTISNSNLIGQTNRFFVSNSFGGNAANTLSNSFIFGSQTEITTQVSGSRSANINHSIIGGNAVKLLVSSSGTISPAIAANLIVGDNLIVTSSYYTAGFVNEPVGSTFLGSFNVADGILNSPQHTRFALGTGTAEAARRTSLSVSSSGLTTISDGLRVTGSLNASNITGSLFGTASFAQLAATASYFDGLVASASYAVFAETAANANTANVANSAINATTAATASSVNGLDQTVTITGSLNISGSIRISQGDDLITHHVQAAAVNGVEIQNNSGNNIALFGAGGSQGTTFYGQVNGTAFSGSGALLYGVTSSFATNFVNSGSYVITGSHRGNVVSQSIASSTASFDFGTGNFFTLNLTGSTLTHISASNIQAGQTVNVRISQGATTGSVSFSPAFDQVSGSAYIPTQVANAVDILTFITFDNSLIYVSNIKNLV